MEERSYWSGWARFLQRWGVIKPVTFLLEVAGPFNIILAQILYFGQPFIGRSTGDQWEALAKMLENPNEIHGFTRFLQEKAST